MIIKRPSRHYCPDADLAIPSKAKIGQQYRVKLKLEQLTHEYKGHILLLDSHTVVIYIKFRNIDLVSNTSTTTTRV